MLMIVFQMNPLLSFTNYSEAPYQNHGVQELEEYLSSDQIISQDRLLRRQPISCLQESRSNLYFQGFLTNV